MENDQIDSAKSDYPLQWLNLRRVVEVCDRSV